MKHIRMSKGFSLVELIAVVAVIGILVAILVPKVQSLNTEAKTNRNAANARLCNDALQRALAKGTITTGVAAADISTYLVSTYIATWPSPAPIGTNADAGSMIYYGDAAAN